MIAQARLVCPTSMQPHARKVMRGEYDLPLDDVKLVLDVGANVGAFAVWASQRWPGCGVRAYEPDPDNYALLVKNTMELVEVSPVNVAVYVQAPLRLYRGKSNCGEASLFPGDGTTDECVQVTGIGPDQLPESDVIKVDTEGCELAILGGYRHLETVRGVAYEWHAERDSVALSRLMQAHGLTCIGRDRWAEHRGVDKWIR